MSATRYAVAACIIDGLDAKTAAEAIGISRQMVRWHTRKLAQEYGLDDERALAGCLLFGATYRDPKPTPCPRPPYPRQEWWSAIARGCM